MREAIMFMMLVTGESVQQALPTDICYLAIVEIQAGRLPRVDLTDGRTETIEAVSCFTLSNSADPCELEEIG